LCVSWFNSSSATAAERPNFVFIIADDVGCEDLGCYGHPTIKTPNLDALAAEGRAFDRAYLTTSSCSPTRCSIITGRYPHNTGAPELHLPLPRHKLRAQPPPHHLRPLRPPNPHKMLHLASPTLEGRRGAAAPRG
jgi:arylsulfatase A-like enzyme